MSPVAILFITFFGLVIMRVPIAHSLVMSSALVIWLVDLNFDLIAQQMFNTNSLFRILVEARNRDAIEPAKQQVTGILQTRHDGEQDDLGPQAHDGSRLFLQRKQWWRKRA